MTTKQISNVVDFATVTVAVFCVAIITDDTCCKYIHWLK